MENHNTRSGKLFHDIEYGIEKGPIVICYHLKSPENMGHMIRLAANFGCERVIFVGDKDAVRESKIKKIAGAAFELVSWSFDPEDKWMQLFDSEYKVLAIETAMGSVDITEFKMPDKVAFVFGNEIKGLPDNIVDLCETSIHIPMTGSVRSMNVSQSCAVALYEWSRQQLNAAD